MIGARVKRREDRRLLTGLGRYVDDVVSVGMLHAAFVRSPHAHAIIRHIDATAAARVPGFVRSLTAADLGPVPPIPVRLGAQAAFTPHLQPPLATGVARFAGEPVAMVLAADRYAAEDAVEAVRVDYTGLPMVGDPEAALTQPGSVVARWEVALGDVAAAIREAHAVVRERFTIHRQTAVPIETRGLVADFDAGRRQLTVWGPTKVPYFNRAVLATMLGLGEGQIHLIEPDVGGGFGARGEFYPEDFLVPFAALVTGRPVKWIETRHEHFLTINHSRGETLEVTVAGRRDGTLLAIDAVLLHDLGAYVRTHGTLVATLAAAHLPGPYRLPSYRCAVSCVLTNRTPMATMRGPGLYEANFARERALDMLAVELGLDAVEIRRRNLVPASCMPYRVGTDVAGIATVYDTGDFPTMFEHTLSRVSKPRGASRPHILTGFGIAAIAEPSGWGPFESARVEVEADGSVRVYTGATSQGQGHETTLAQVCSAVLGVPVEAISVTHGDTQLMRFGVGTYASRAAVTAGSAVFQAADRVRERALRLAARYLEAALADLVVTDGRVHVSGFPDRSVTLGALARMAAPGYHGPGASAPTEGSDGLTATAYFHVSEETSGFSVHTAEVSVDPETGTTRVERYVVAADAGRAINPTIVEAQLVGGAVQGVGGALHEELVHDGDGQLLTGTLMEYAVPTAGEAGPVDVIVFESHAPSNPLGAKGVGEAGTSGAGAAVANAVADALRPLGARITELPLTPARIHRAIEEAKEARRSSPS
ncbi:MAG TPA: xanthine dehydrogenase family protein molybdopterin-binding subunit [Candidatus Methylomirabilis sp.]|nr:xanthine dehydrogenase family protein molybdopterin-binding subunit [Candidatus Methylomirabilis sp.]